MGDPVKTDQQPYRLSFHLVVLEAIGAVLIGLGLASAIAGIDIIPAAYLFAGYGPVFIGLGVLLMLPGIISLLQQFKERIGSDGRRDS